MKVLYVVDVCETTRQQPPFPPKRGYSTHSVTREALHAVPILPLEEVDDEAVVAHAVDLPLLLARNLRGHPLELRLALWRAFDLGLLQDPVQVLVQTVKQEAQELLRVVLFRARELRRMAAYRSL